MTTDQREVAVAYTYAWWLSGDDDAAADAVRRASADPAVTGADDDERFTTLLRAVRALAAPAPTMCPASELALLHDPLGLNLELAAELCGVAPRDATVELAHGRMEALLETVREEFDHPERLGGLAVGNPADVAHARQCDSCGRVRMLLARGRDELEKLGTMRPPTALVDAAAAAPSTPPAPPDEASAPPDDEPAPHDDVPLVDEMPATQDDDADSGRGGGVAPPPPDVVDPADDRADDRGATEVEEHAPDGVPEPEVDEDEDEDEGEGEEPARRGSLLPLVVGGLILAMAVVVLMLVFARTQVDDGALPEPGGSPPTQQETEPGVVTATAEQPTPANGETQAQPPAEGGFVVSGAGLLIGTASTPAQSGATIGATEPVVLAVDYRGGAEGVVLAGEWTVDGEPFRTFPAVTVGGADNRHIYDSVVPADGWPTGVHRVVLTGDAEIVGAVDWVVE